MKYCYKWPGAKRFQSQDIDRLCETIQVLGNIIEDAARDLILIIETNVENSQKKE